MNRFLSRKAVVVSLLTITLSILAFSLFSSSGRDDVYITYWASYSLSHWGEIINYNGMPVEQSSSLLHTVLLAVLNFFTGIKLHLIGPLFSLICAFLTLLQTYKLGKKWNHEVGIISAIILSTSTFFVYWSISGLESTLMAFLSVSLVYYLAVYFTKLRTWRRNVFIFCLILSFILIRPENIFVIFSMLVGFAGLFIILHLRGNHNLYQQTNTFLFLSNISFTAILIMILFRYYYFGDLFPQPVTAKLSGITLSSIENGYEYLKKNFSFGMGEFKFIISLSSICYISKKIFTAKRLKVNFYFFVTLFSFLFITAYISFILLSGGDWMEGGRFIAPILPFTSLLIAYTVSELPLIKWTKVAAVMLLVVLQLGIMLQFAAEQSTGVPINRGIHFYRNYDRQLTTKNYSWFELTNRVHLRDIPMIDQLEKIIGDLKAESDEPIQILTKQMGMIPYFLSLEYYGDIEFTDLRGLTDRKFSRCVDKFYLQKSTAGIQVDLIHYLNNHELYKELCGIQQPHIIFTLGSHMTQELANIEAYQIIYRQEGLIESGSRIFNGKLIYGDMAIAIQRDLMKRSGSFHTLNRKFHHIMP